MKPYRVKRGQKFIGSFIVVHDGQRVNLGTKDANEARRRAALVAKGLWPPDEGAAAAVKRSLEGGEEPPVSVPPAVPPPPALPEPIEVPAEPVPRAPPAPPPMPSAQAVNETAAAEADDLENQAKSVLADAGVDMSEIVAKAPSLLAGAHLYIQGQLCRLGVRVVKGRYPAMVTLPEGDGLRDMLGKLWTAQLQKWNLDPSAIGIGWWLVIVSGVTAMAQVGGMLAAIEEEEKKAVN
jgi:hypothetical protein